MHPVSAVIITRNEERYIERCLSSLDWADEILVVDAESQDRTRQICEDPEKPWSDKLRLLSRKWTGFKDQRNFAISKAKNDWVFVIDSDEKCSEELVEKLNQFRIGAEKPKSKYFKVRRVEFFLGKPIEHGVWNPSYQDRFFDRRGVQYVNDVHEYPVFPKEPKRIHEPLYHAPDLSPDRILDKMNRYTSIEAKERFENGQRTHLVHLIFSGPAMFLKNYFYYGAYRDGIHGLIVSLLEGISRTVRHIKIWQHTQEQKRS